jgi:hypothetical protein
MKPIEVILEILFVFIGVFLAFYTQNFIENKREQELNTFILTTLVSDLEDDLLEISENINILDNSITYTQDVIDRGSANIEQLDTISHHVIFLHSESAYIQLANKGFGIIENNNLRNMIIQLYAIQYDYISSKEEDITALQVNILFNNDFMYSKDISPLSNVELGKLNLIKNKKKSLLKLYKETVLKIKGLLKTLKNS